MTAQSFEEARKGLLRSLAHHMILLAERAQIMDDSKANHNILENSYLTWTGKAVFKWQAVRSIDTEDLEGSFHRLTRHCTVVDAQELGLADSIGEQTPLLSNPLPAFTSELPLDIVSSDHYEAPFFQISGSSSDSLHSRLLVCDSALGVDVDVDGICGLCPPLSLDVPIDMIPDHLDDPQQGQLVSEAQTPVDHHSKPYLKRQWDWWDFPDFEVQNMSGVPVPGLPNPPTVYPILPGISDASDTSCLSMPEIEYGSIPMTCDVPESASPMHAFEKPSFGIGLLNSDDADGGRMHCSGLPFQNLESCKLTRSQQFPMDEKALQMKYVCVPCDSAERDSEVFISLL